MATQNDIMTELYKRYPALTACGQDIGDATRRLLTAVRGGGKILLCGNGGSCADCEHISGELLKGFLSMRPLSETDKRAFDGLPQGDALANRLQYGICAIPLTSLTAVSTAFCNDVDPAAVYAQLTYAIGAPGDVLIAISTSGNAENVRNAAVAAKAKGLTVIGLTGQTGGKLAALCDVCIRVPESETFKVQELHLPVYHAICAALEAEMFG